jgi:putative DNA primase/helicase
MDSFRASDVRAVLGPLVTLAEELAISIVGVLHFNKKVDVHNAVLRISDSLAFGAVARHIYATVPDDENQCRLFVRAKNNLAPDSTPSLAFDFIASEVGFDQRLGKPIIAPHVRWLGHVDVSAIDAMRAASEGKGKASTVLDDTKEFLAKLLADGPMLQKEVVDAARRADLAPHPGAREEKLRRHRAAGQWSGRGGLLAMGTT